MLLGMRFYDGFQNIFKTKLRIVIWEVKTQKCAFSWLWNVNTVTILKPILYSCFMKVLMKRWRLLFVVIALNLLKYWIYGSIKLNRTSVDDWTSTAIHPSTRPSHSPQLPTEIIKYDSNKKEVKSLAPSCRVRSCVRIARTRRMRLHRQDLSQ